MDIADALDRIQNGGRLSASELASLKASEARRSRQADTVGGSFSTGQDPQFKKMGAVVAEFGQASIQGPLGGPVPSELQVMLISEVFG
jgi:hypothetical protein